MTPEQSALVTALIFSWFIGYGTGMLMRFIRVNLEQWLS